MRVLSVIVFVLIGAPDNSTVSGSYMDPSTGNRRSTRVRARMEVSTTPLPETDGTSTSHIEPGLEDKESAEHLEVVSPRQTAAGGLIDLRNLSMTGIVGSTIFALSAVVYFLIKMFGK